MHLYKTSGLKQIVLRRVDTKEKRIIIIKCRKYLADFHNFIFFWAGKYSPAW